MILNSIPLSSIFLTKQKARLLAQRQNEFITNISKEDSVKLLEWISNKVKYCKVCKTQFYSNVGYVNHICEGEK